MMMLGHHPCHRVVAATGLPVIASLMAFSIETELDDLPARPRVGVQMEDASVPRILIQLKSDVAQVLAEREVSAVAMRQQLSNPTGWLRRKPLKHVAR
jgi:hypothetical protein